MELIDRQALHNLTGQRFGKLVVVGEGKPAANRLSTWKCLCDCGRETTVRGDALKRGRSKSCGCGNGVIHGYYYKPWYSSYKAMMERCYLPTSGNYKRYGGKGVEVCKEWHDINKFACWVETSNYKPGLTLDRIDSNKGYSPENCRWATKKEQSNNRKNTIFYTYKGETKALTDWSEELGINRFTLYSRIEERGWSVERAFETPVVHPNCGADMRGGAEDGC